MGQTRFEEYCGITLGTINKIGPKGLGATILSEILLKCPDLNARWLITGEGEMFVSTAHPMIEKSSVPLNNVHGNVVFVGNWDGLTPVIEAALDKALKK